MYLAKCLKCGNSYVTIKQVAGQPPLSDFMTEIQEARGKKGEG